jgi:hypothetical protein
LGELKMITRRKKANNREKQAFVVRETKVLRE